MPIEWSKLKPYQHDKRKSFEELCYQIAKSKYSHQGNFTSIDDSGGGDGVEFYLTLPNGDEWGWQAKFYFPDKRLIASRRSSVVESLNVSLSKHNSLRKWFLCTPTNLSPKGKQSELDWFRTDLQKIAGDVSLVHWGESDFVDFLADPRLVGKRYFFFGELELSAGWFRAQVDKQLANVGDKFIEQLHSATYGDAQVHNTIGNDTFLSTLRAARSALLTHVESMQEKALRKVGGALSNSAWKDLAERLTVEGNQAIGNLNAAVVAIDSVLVFVSAGDFEGAGGIDLDSPREAFRSSSEAYFNTCRDAENKLSPPAAGAETQTEHNIADSTKETINGFRSVLTEGDNALTTLWMVASAFKSFKNGILHVLANAGFGKTHLACHIVSSRVNKGLPAILLLGEQFGKADTIENRIRQICDIPPGYSWADFVAALESCAEAYRTRLVIAIDALNEAEGVDVWRQQLSGFVSTLRSRRIVLLTTSRSSYEKQIWPADAGDDGRVHLHGFTDSILSEAVARYFQYFKIRADLTFESIEQFRNPLYLRIFCEAVNRDRKIEQEIFVGRQYILSVFEQFLERRNGSFSARVRKPPSLKFLQRMLRQFARQLWQQNARHLTLGEATRLLDGKRPERADFDWHNSFTKALLNEELLIKRDAFGGGETVLFTYDLLGGYLIADELLSELNGKSAVEFTRDPGVIAKLIGDDYRERHPLHEDILRCYHLLLPSRTGQHTYKLKVKGFYPSAIRALFEMDPKYLAIDESHEVEGLFSDPRNRKAVLRSLRNTALVPKHPFNVHLCSKLLRGLEVAERDTSWSELLRKETDLFSPVVDALEKACRSGKDLRRMKDRLRLVANYVAWMLTSTNQELRDTATRALYWYGRRFPASLFRLTLASLRLNDPYIPERMLAAAYGVCMALHCRPKRSLFRTKLLSALGRHIYNDMFAPSAAHSTTHALSRDFAYRIIDLARLHAPALLDEAEKNRVVPPFKEGGIRVWQVMEDANEDKYREGNAPLGMDFKNYTIGRLIPRRQNYDFENEEYKKVVGQIIWRIYQLGYSLEVFGEIDKDIARWSYYGRAERPHVERYGKKYAWIAYFEQYGLRKDEGLLKDDWGEGEERPSDIDIDPSFPDEPHKLRLIGDLLGDRSGDIRDWVQRGPTPEFRRYLHRPEFLQVKGPWVLLDGHCSQRDKDAERISFVILQSFLLLKEDENEFVRLIKKEPPRGRWLPDEGEDNYTFLGEVPWCDTFPHNEITSVNFVTGITKVKVSPDDPRHSLRIIFDLGDSKQEIKTRKRPKFEEVNIYKRVPVYVPIRQNSFSSSAGMERVSCVVPAKELAEYFTLWLNLPSWDMYDQSERICSIVTADGSLGDYERHLFFREDLLDKLLSSQNLGLVWVVWGERQHFGERHMRTAPPAHGYKYFQQVYRYRHGGAERVK